MTQPTGPYDPADEDGSPGDFVERGKVLIVRQQFNEAVKVCRLGLLVNPTSVEGRLVLGMALMALGRHDEVLAEMRAALQVEPDNPMAHLLKGEALFNKKDFDQAQEVLLHAQDLDPLNDKVNTLLDDIDRLVDYDDAIPRAATDTKVYPSSAARGIEVTREIHDVPSAVEMLEGIQEQETMPGEYADMALPDDDDEPDVVVVDEEYLEAMEDGDWEEDPGEMTRIDDSPLALEGTEPADDPPATDVEPVAPEPAALDPFALEPAEAPDTDSIPALDATPPIMEMPSTLDDIPDLEDIPEVGDGEDEEEEDRYLTAPYLPPSYLEQIRRDAAAEHDMLAEEETLAERDPPSVVEILSGDSPFDYAPSSVEVLEDPEGLGEVIEDEELDRLVDQLHQSVGEGGIHAEPTEAQDVGVLFAEEEPDVPGLEVGEYEEEAPTITEDDAQAFEERVSLAATADVGVYDDEEEVVVDDEDGEVELLLPEAEAETVTGEEGDYSPLPMEVMDGDEDDQLDDATWDDEFEDEEPTMAEDGDELLSQLDDLRQRAQELTRAPDAEVDLPPSDLVALSDLAEDGEDSVEVQGPYAARPSFTPEDDLEPLAHEVVDPGNVAGTEELPPAEAMYENVPVEAPDPTSSWDDLELPRVPEESTKAIELDDLEELDEDQTSFLQPEVDPLEEEGTPAPEGSWAFAEAELEPTDLGHPEVEDDAFSGELAGLELAEEQEPTSFVQTDGVEEEETGFVDVDEEPTSFLQADEEAQEEFYAEEEQPADPDESGGYDDSGDYFDPERAGGAPYPDEDRGELESLDEDPTGYHTPAPVMVEEEDELASTGYHTPAPVMVEEEDELASTGYHTPAPVMVDESASLGPVDPYDDGLDDPSVPDMASVGYIPDANLEDASGSSVALSSRDIEDVSDAEVLSMDDISEISISDVDEISVEMVHDDAMPPLPPDADEISQLDAVESWEPEPNAELDWEPEPDPELDAIPDPFEEETLNQPEVVEEPTRVKFDLKAEDLAKYGLDGKVVEEGDEQGAGPDEFDEPYPDDYGAPEEIGGPDEFAPDAGYGQQADNGGYGAQDQFGAPGDAFDAAVDLEGPGGFDANLDVPGSFDGTRSLDEPPGLDGTPVLEDVVGFDGHRSLDVPAEGFDQPYEAPAVDPVPDLRDPYSSFDVRPGAAAEPFAPPHENLHFSYPPESDAEPALPFSPSPPVGPEERPDLFAASEQPQPWSPPQHTADMSQIDAPPEPYQPPVPAPLVPSISETADINDAAPGLYEGRMSQLAPPLRRETTAPAGDDDFFRQRAPSYSKDIKARRILPMQDRTTTSLLDMLKGKPGSHRMIFLVLGTVVVVGLAVGVGLLVRYLRIDDQIESKRYVASSSLQAGNFSDYVAAARSYSEIVKQFPDDKKARWTLMRIKAAIPFEFGDAVTQDARASGDDDDDASNADRAAAEIYAALYSGSLKKANEALSAAQKAHSNNALLLYLEGRTRLLEGDASAAETALESAAKKDAKDALILRWLGESLAAQGKYSDAVDAFDKALGLNDNHVPSILGKVRVELARGGSLDNSIKEVDSVLKGKRAGMTSKGQQGWAYLLSARLAAATGAGSRAVSHLNKAKKHKPKGDAHFMDELAQALTESYQLSEAERVINESRRLIKDRPYTHLLMAQVRLLQGNPSVALAELKQAKGLESLAVNLLQAKINIRLNRLFEARREVDKVLEESPDLIAAHIVKAKILAAQDKGSTAKEMLRGLIRRHPKNAKLLTALGEVYLRLNRPRDARDRFRDAINLDRREVEAVLLLADVYLAEGNFDQARKQLADATRDNSGNILAVKKLAGLEMLMGDRRKAKAGYQAVLNQAPNDPGARLGMARVLTAMHEYTSADAEIRAAEARQAPAREVTMTKGGLALAQGDAQGAVTHMTSATKSDPKDMNAWDMLVQAHLMSNDEVSASSVVDTIGARSRGSVTAFITAGRVALYNGKSRQAKRHFTLAVQAAKQKPLPPVLHSELLVLLGRAYQDGGGLEEALAQYGQASRVCASCPQPSYRMGLALDENGRVTDALAALRRARTLDPKMAAVYYDLGQVLERDGQKAAAKRAYRKYLSLNPPKELAEAAKQALKNL